MDGKPTNEEWRDDFECPQHEDSLHATMEMEHILQEAGPEALAAMPNVDKVTLIWKSRADGKKKKVEVDVHFKDGGSTALLNVPFGKWCDGRFGLGRSQISPELFGDDCYTDEDGHCWGRIEECVRPDPAKLAAFRAGHPVDSRSGASADARDAWAAKIVLLVVLVLVGSGIASAVGAEGILGKVIVLGIVGGIAGIGSALLRR